MVIIELIFHLILPLSILSTVQASKQSIKLASWPWTMKFWWNTKTYLVERFHIICIVSLGSFVLKKFREANPSITPKLFTIMTIGLSSSAAMHMTLMIVHTTPTATCSSPEVDYIFCFSFILLRPALQRVTFWFDGQTRMIIDETVILNKVTCDPCHCWVILTHHNL